MELSDEMLCQRVADRDEAAFDLLVSRYQERACRLAWSILRNAEDARDVSQEAFIRLYEAAGSFDGRARFSTWVYRILVNLCLDHRRKHRWWRGVLTAGQEGGSEGSTVDWPAASFEDPVDRLGKEETVKQIWALVDRLSPQQRAALLLQVREDLPTSEIASVLKCSEATVRVHLHRGLAALRKMLRKG